MNNIAFVNKLISATQTGSIEWDNASSAVMQKYPDYDSILSFSRQKYEILIAKIDMKNMAHPYKEDIYNLLIVDSESLEEKFCIDSENLLENSWNSYSKREFDLTALSRLYTLAERSLNKIDEIFELIAQDLDDGDELPF